MTITVGPFCEDRRVCVYTVCTFVIDGTALKSSQNDKCLRPML